MSNLVAFPSNSSDAHARQQTQIEALQAAAQRYQARPSVPASKQQDESERLASENASLKADLISANQRCLELEATVSRLSEQPSNSKGAASQVDLNLRIQAYQRHNGYLQGEVATAEARLLAAREQIDVLRNEIQNRDERVSILMDKIRQYNLEPNLTEQRVYLTEAAYKEMKEKMLNLQNSIEATREKMEGMQEEAVRREEIIGSLRRENDALKNTVSRLIAISMGSSVLTSIARPAYSGSSAADKLSIYRKNTARREEAYTDQIRHGDSEVDDQLL